MRKCPKAIDRPFSILGLDIDEMCILIVIFYAILSISYLLIASVFVCFTWPFILRIKKGKPKGALIHFLYKLGLPLEGLIPPVKNDEKFALVSKAFSKG